MAPFYHPTTSFMLWIPPFRISFFPALFDMRYVLTKTAFHQHWHSRISFVGTKMMSPSFLGHRTLRFYRIKRSCHQFRVMNIRPAHDEGQRDSTRVDQQTALCTFFFPDPWDWDPQLLLQEVLYSSHHQYSAISRQCLPSRCIQKAPFSIASQKNQQPAIQENTDGWRWRFHRLLSVTLSTAPQSEAHTQFLQKPCDDEALFDPRQASEYIFCHVFFVSWVSMAQLLPKIHRTPPTNIFSSYSCNKMYIFVPENSIYG
jgi:hypothetical protein